MASTYEPIATTTLGSTASSITFSSIPSTYTDLRIVFVGTVTSQSNLYLRYNSDSSSIYSDTFVYATGSTKASSSDLTTGQIYLSIWNQLSATIPTMRTVDIFSYAGSTYKTCLVKESSDFNGSGSTVITVGLWRSTSAINTVALINPSSTFAAGTIATVYGIKAA